MYIPSSVASEKANVSAAKELLTTHLILLDCQLRTEHFVFSPAKNIK